MAPDLRVFLASADRELAGLVADAPGLQLTGATADRAIAQAALASRRADVYVLDWRVAEVPEDLRAIDADIFAAAAVVAEGSPPLAGWERASARRRLFAEPYEPLEIVAWAQWLGETQHEYRSPPGPVQAAPPPLEVGAASSRAQAAAVLTSAPPSTGAPEGREERLRLRGLRPVPPGSGAGQPAAAAPSRVGRLVAVCSPKGGVGKTMVAANLSAALAGLGEDVLLTDLDLASPDIGLHFDLEGGPTLLDILPKLDVWDRTRAERELPRHASGVRILRGPARPDLAQYVQVEDVTRLLGWARERFAWTVVDTAPDAAQDSLYEVIEQADVTLLVSSLDAASLQRTRIFLRLLRQLSLPRSGDLRLVVNRASAGSPVSIGGLQGYLGLPPAAVIPEDARACENAVFDGQPLVWRGKPAALVEPVRRLAAELSGQAPPQARRPPWSGWTAWPRRVRG